MGIHQGKVAVVTGGSRGIGRAIVEKLARLGASVHFTYRAHADTAEQLTNDLSAEGHTVKAWQVDVRDLAGMNALIQTVFATEKRIDTLINNAGIIRDELMMAMSTDDWQDVIETNLTGAFGAIKPVIPFMMRQRSGSIIAIASVAGLRPGRGQANYAASKAGIVGLTKALASELGSRGIRVNAVAPGMIATDMSQAVRETHGDKILDAIKLRRFGNPEDVANAVSFLASEDSAYITGTVLPVDGGLIL